MQWDQENQQRKRKLMKAPGDPRLQNNRNLQKLLMQVYQELHSLELKKKSPVNKLLQPQLQKKRKKNLLDPGDLMLV